VEPLMGFCRYRASTWRLLIVCPMLCSMYYYIVQFVNGYYCRTFDKQ
jgi:hypothetical protein